MISIVIPCYNHNKIVDRAVQSAIRQTYDEPYETIVVDDGSTERVENVWGRGVRVIRHKQNEGLSRALNTGITRSKGDRFVILSADDELHPDHLAITSQYAADIVSTDMMVRGQVIRSAAGDVHALMDGNCHSYAALIRRDMFDKVGGFKAAMNPSWEDYEFFLNCASHGAKWHHVPKGLHIYRRNPTGRDAMAQGKDRLLRGKLEGYHNDLFGAGRGLVTFVVPCYNHEQYLPEAVRSALDQIYPHVKVIVVDDGSPGDVDAALDGADLLNDERVYVMRKKVNSGLASARNSGMAYATTRYGSQYAVMLDADDKVSPDYVEETMPELTDYHYVYSDVKLFGDAWHEVQMEDYDCSRLRKKHLHPCTFLMLTGMWQSIFVERGYGYDEGEIMRIGYEDWEFAIACAEKGWSGTRVPKPLFMYRNHKDGSMRTRAGKNARILAEYIHRKHPKLRNEGMWDMGCPGCGNKAKFTRTSGTVHISKLGNVDPGEPLVVTYSGNTSSTITKIGRGGRIYKYSNTPENTYGPTFSIVAMDAHLFANGPYVIKRVVEAAVAVVMSDDTSRALPDDPMMTPQPQANKEMVIPEDAGIEFEADDFVEMGATEKQAKALTDAGIRYYEDVADMPSPELGNMIRVSESRAKALISRARELIDELGELVVDG